MATIYLSLSLKRMSESTTKGEIDLRIGDIKLLSFVLKLFLALKVKAGLI